MTKPTLSETSFAIPVADGKLIYGISHNPTQKTSSAVVLVHGLTGHMNEYLHLMMAKDLTCRGHAVFRFNQYGDEKDARRFHETTISLHVSDTVSVVDYVERQGYSNITLIGHSLGSPVAIAATDARVGALILLDPTGPPKIRIKSWQVYDEQHAISYLDWTLRIILGEGWVEDAKNFPDSYDQFSKVSCKVKIIAAERAEQMVYCERYNQVHPSRPEILIIPGASHCFTEEGTIENVCAAIGEWLKP